VVHETLLEAGAAAAATPVRGRRRAGRGPPSRCWSTPTCSPCCPSTWFAPRLIAGLAGRAGGRRAEELRRVAHQLAGSFGLYGFKWASDQCRWIEKNFADVDAARLDDIAGRCTRTCTVHRGHGRRLPGGHRFPHEGEAMLAKKLILLVDDDQSVLSYLTTKLSKLYDVVSTATRARRRTWRRRERPDVILCDIDMPGMSGGEVAAQLEKTR
jgi:hypothetical protein